jgi:hypothetical protein
MLNPITMTAPGIPSSESFAIGTMTAALGSSSQTLTRKWSISAEQSSTRTTRRDCKASLIGQWSAGLISRSSDGVDERIAGGPERVEKTDMVGELVMLCEKGPGTLGRPSRTRLDTVMLIWAGAEE